jgi:hydrogenase maturation protein HypF
LKIDDLPFLKSLDAEAVAIVRQQAKKRLNAPETSSMGRLFDAVAALAGVRNEVTYEAQAAMELEVISKSALSRAGTYPFEIEGDVVLLDELLERVIEDVRRNESAGLIGARFHHTICKMAVEVSKRIREGSGIREVALSGGVWQNQVLLDLTRSALLKEDFVVFTHRSTPANDGGLALGQAVVAQATGGAYVP